MQRMEKNKDKTIPAIREKISKDGKKYVSLAEFSGNFLAKNPLCSPNLETCLRCGLKRERR